MHEYEILRDMGFVYMLDSQGFMHALYSLDI